MKARRARLVQSESYRELGGGKTNGIGLGTRSSECGSVDVALLAVMLMGVTLGLVTDFSKAGPRLHGVIALLNERGSLDPLQESEAEALQWPRDGTVSWPGAAAWPPLMIPLDYSPRGSARKERPWFLCQLLANAAVTSAKLWRDFCV